MLYQDIPSSLQLYMSVQDTIVGTLTKYWFDSTTVFLKVMQTTRVIIQKKKREEGDKKEKIKFFLETSKHIETMEFVGYLPRSIYPF